MYCRNCGSPLSDGTRFCPSCGAAVDPSQDRTTVMGGARHAAGPTAPDPTATAPANPGSTAPVTPPNQTVTMRMPRARASNAGGTRASAPAPSPVPSPRSSDPYEQPSDRRRRSSGNGMIVVVAIALVAAAALAFFFLVVVPGMRGTSNGDGADAATSSIFDNVGDLPDSDADDEGAQDDSSETGSDEVDEDSSAADADASSVTDGGTGSDAGTSGTSQVSYGAYANMRYGFSVSVPTSFASYGESDNGDGATFEDAATGATILAWGSNNALAEGAEDIADSYADGHDLIDRAVYGNAFDLWYRSGDRIVRVHGVVGEGSYNVVQIEYPESQARQLASVSDHVANSLVAGDLSVGH